MAKRTDTVEIKRTKKDTQFKEGKAGGPGRPAGTGYKQRALQSFMGLLSGSEGEQFLRDYLSKFKMGAKKQNTWQSRFLAERLFKDNVLDEIDEWLTRGEKREIAFLHYRLHKESTDMQRQILFTMSKYLFLMAGRRGAKTVGLRQWFADEFIDHGDARCLYIGLTSTTAMGLLWTPMLDKLEDLGIKIKGHNRVEGTITTADDGIMKFGGNATQDEREKNRGPYWDRVGIDECQSQKQLRYLVESIILPTLIDKAGQLAMGGTGPRVRGTYWEEVFLGVKPDGTPVYSDALRLNWNLTHNPFIPDHEHQLEMIRAEKNLKETDPLYIREYLGRIAYDDDALVLRLTEENSFDDAQLKAWIDSQPVTDVRFSSGLDFGFEDADALAVVCYSISLPQRFLVYEWKANRKGTEEIAQACRAGIDYVNTSPIFSKVVNKNFDIHADTGGNAITPFDLNNTYHLPIQAAYNQEKEMAFELLQDETRRGVFKCRKDGPLWDESLKTIYKRNEQDQLTREIDDETYHPDQMRAVHYAMRPIQLFTGGQG
jgi:hypothetical protein